jgi:hypothetical protein
LVNQTSSLVDDGKGVTPTIANIIVIVIQYKWHLAQRNKKGVWKKNEGGKQKGKERKKKCKGFFYIALLLLFSCLLPTLNT